MERDVLRRTRVSALHRIQRIRRSRGFTLVELAIVVAIVGVLAVIAVVGYRKYMLASKMTEGRQMIGAVRLAQESVRSEKGTYANIGAGNWCPNATPTGGKKTMWNPQCDGGTSKWAVLPVHSDGAVHFGYKTVAGASGVAPNTTIFSGMVDYSAGKTGNWYVVGALCDLDESSTTGSTQLAGSSYDNSIRTLNDGY